LANRIKSFHLWIPKSAVLAVRLNLIRRGYPKDAATNVPQIPHHGAIVGRLNLLLQQAEPAKQCKYRKISGMDIGQNCLPWVTSNLTRIPKNNAIL